MSRQNNQGPARHRVPHQIDLFAEGSQAIAQMPAWSGLPPETRASLTALMTRLILDHADRTCVGLGPGGADDL
jgi:hypothetical protein